MLNIIMMGPQGSGKGTQAKLLAKKYNLEHIEPGKVLRELASQGGLLGKKIEYYLLKGRLVPSDLLFFKVLKPRLADFSQRKGFVLDGAPRELKQAEYLDSILKVLGRKITYIFYIKISEKETFKRLGKRLTCKKCDRPLILGVDVQDQKEKCPHCGGSLYQRADDTPAGIKKRLEIFHKETIPVLEYFRKQKNLIEIDGEQPIPKVHQDIIRYIKSVTRNP